MKITQMIEREDFYTLNEQTLLRYFSGCTAMTPLYVYPRINAIITAVPSRRVKEYLLCEFDVRANVTKRLAVKGYVQLCLNSRRSEERRVGKECR